MDWLSQQVMKALSGINSAAAMSAAQQAIPPQALGNVPGNPNAPGYSAVPRMAAAPDPMMLAGAYDDPMGASIAPLPSPMQIPPVNVTASAPATPPSLSPSLLTPQSITPLTGAPQSLSPLVSGGALPALPAGGLPGAGQQDGGPGLWDVLGRPSVSRGLIQAGLRMMAAGTPSTDPRAGSLGYGISEGLGGYLEGQDEQAAIDRQRESDEANRLYKAAMIEKLMRGEPAKAPPVETIYDANGREQRVVWNAATGQYEPLGGSKAAPLLRGGAGGAGSARNLGGYSGKEEQNKAVAYGSYINRALPTIEAVSTAGRQPDWFQRLASDNLPFGLGNFFVDDNARSFLQAEKEIAAAVLRRETGAAFTEDELRDVRARYIPQPGDDQATINQKLRALNEIRRSYWIQTGLPEEQWDAFSGIETTPSLPTTGANGLPPGFVEVR